MKATEMKRGIKFRQIIVDKNGKFKSFAYWGFIDNEFISPAFQSGHPSTAKESDQFTGLLDKSGKEIYERDIVKAYGYEVRNGHQIRPERIFAINDFIKDTYRLLCITEGTGETVEVIGNIYENPDLL